MEGERDNMSERILSLTLEIIYLLTGEDYTVVKDTPDKHMIATSHASVSRGWNKSQSNFMDSPGSVKLTKTNYNKILEVTSKIIELLTGEVPIRCQDITVYFSMEEWKYLVEHKDLYKDVKMEDQPPLTLLDESSNRKTPERCPLYTWLYCEGKNDSVCDVIHTSKLPKKRKVNPLQDEGLIVLTAEDEEESFVRGDDLCKEEEIPPEISTDGGYSMSNMEKSLIISPEGEIDDDITSESSEENPIIPNLPLQIPDPDPSSDPCTYGKSSLDQSPPIVNHPGRRVAQTLPCPECGECFPDKSDLLSHQASHTSEKSYSCSECGKCFTQSVYLILHERLHMGEKPFSCFDCGRWFSRKSSLTTHEKVHSFEKPYLCTECGKSFTQKSGLKRHKKGHTGYRPYSCTECGKCFLQKSDVDRHQRIHTGEKPYSCSKCGKCFSQKSILITHEKVHSGEKLYSCTECGKCFTDRFYLAAHQIIHTPDRS